MKKTDVTKTIIAKDDKIISGIMKLRFNPFVAERGKGALLWDENGKKHIDFTSAWGVMNVGYSHPEIVKTANEQMEKLSFVSSCSAIHKESALLAEELISKTPGSFKKKVWYGHSGSDANELISKIIPIVKRRPRIITFVGSYHGQTAGSYAMSGHPSQSKFISGGNITKIPYPYCYHCPFDKRKESCHLYCLDHLEKYIFDSIVDPTQVGAIVVEAIQCDGGDVVPPDGFLERVEKLCKKHEMYLIFDEVKVGFGRTGKFFGFEHFNVIPDAVVVAKPMGAGQPISAVIGREEIFAIPPATYLFTTAGNPVACAVARKVMEIIEKEKLMGNAKEMGDLIQKRLNALKKKYKVIGDVRSLGLVIGLEFVEPGEERRPNPTFAMAAAYRAYELGLLVYPVGIHSNVLEIMPPLMISEDEVLEGLDMLETAIDEINSGKFSPEKIEKFAGWGI